MYKKIETLMEDINEVNNKINENTEYAETLKSIGVSTVHILYTDIDEWVTQKVTDGQVSLLPGKIGNAPVIEKIDTETFGRIFSGEIEPPEAACEGKVDFEGDFSVMLTLQPLLEIMRKHFKPIYEKRQSCAS